MEHANVADYEEIILQPSFITGKFPVPKSWVGAGKLLPEVPIPGSEPIPILVKDELGDDTILRLTVRKPKEDGTKYYMKPEFMFKEWQALVDKYKLKEGESVYFWKDGCFLRIKVRVPPRTFILFGTRVLV